MTTFTVSNKKLSEHKVSCYAFILSQNFKIEHELKEFSDTIFPGISTYFKEHPFSGKRSDIRALPIITKDTCAHALFVGVGKGDDDKPIDIEYLRRAVAHIVKKASSLACDTLLLVMPDAQLFNTTPEELAKQTALITHMALYHFDTYITEESRKVKPIKDIILLTDANRDAIIQGLDKGVCIARGVNKARYWIDLPPTDLTPPHLAEKAVEIANATGLKCTVFTEQQINEMGMGGLAAVSRGSDLDCKLVILEYTTKKKNAPTIALVGKGITFDSGGLSLKPADYMETMKDDMSGAAAVISTMEIVATLQPDVNVIGVTPLAENLPSGKATKPGDIIRFYNGKTAEIKNTDAEGRLILGDALSYVVKHYDPTVIIDIATLTGSCSHALGPFYSGLMSEHDELVEKIYEASARSGERVWQLPMHDDYKKAIIADVADICNIGSKRYRAGAITAACFLQHFVGDIPWAHLDIAGTAFDVPDMPYYRPGATGVGVRLFIELIMHWK